MLKSRQDQTCSSCNFVEVVLLAVCPSVIKMSDFNGNFQKVRPITVKKNYTKSYFMNTIAFAPIFVREFKL